MRIQGLMKSQTESAYAGEKGLNANLLPLQKGRVETLTFPREEIKWAQSLFGKRDSSVKA